MFLPLIVMKRHADLISSILRIFIIFDVMVLAMLAVCRYLVFNVDPNVFTTLLTFLMAALALLGGLNGKKLSN